MKEKRFELIYPLGRSLPQQPRVTLRLKAQDESTARENAERISLKGWGKAEKISPTVWSDPRKSSCHEIGRILKENDFDIRVEQLSE